MNFNQRQPAADLKDKDCPNDSSLIQKATRCAYALIIQRSWKSRNKRTHTHTKRHLLLQTLTNKSVRYRKPHTDTHTATHTQSLSLRELNTLDVYNRIPNILSMYLHFTTNCINILTHTANWLNIP